MITDKTFTMTPGPDEEIIITNLTIGLDWKDRLKALFGFRISMIIRTKVKIVPAVDDSSKRTHGVRCGEQETYLWLWWPIRKLRLMSKDAGSETAVGSVGRE